MERPPLVMRTKIITSVEDQLVTLQRDTDAEYYEPIIQALSEELERLKGKLNNESIEH